MLGLRCCIRVFPTCVGRGLLSSSGVRASHGRGFFFLWLTGSFVSRLQSLQLESLVTPQHVGIFPDQGLTLGLLHWQVDFFFFKIYIYLALPGLGFGTWDL